MLGVAPGVRPVAVLLSFGACGPGVHSPGVVSVLGESFFGWQACEIVIGFSIGDSVYKTECFNLVVL